jgi:hypothetical protein
MIPAWNMAGIIPPIWPGQEGQSTERSPYTASLSILIERFGLTAERRKILEGLLAYRAALHANGLTSGFQWLDGSFLQDIESQQDRPPNDIDVVTYFRLPAAISQAMLVIKAGALFDHDYVKKTYHVDAYQGVLGGPLDENLIRRVSYWYSMWSHQRDHTWKGFVQVNLSPDEDMSASAMLACLNSGGITS